MSVIEPIHFGFLVDPCPSALDPTETLYAEIRPASTRWLPWPGRTSRWWYEIHSVHEPDENGVAASTYAYLDGGSGGGFTLRSCVVKASVAVDHFASTPVEPS